MTLILEAIYDGNVLRPVQPLDLKPNTRLRITVETKEPEPKVRRSFLQTARSLELDGPADWSARIEEYLYGDDADAAK
ncbi:MAG: antitoxin family protein [Acidobacteria bacterium]|nr:antitoxin family protein [Acidobacteriota bacterium]MBI3427218.1 antitoxin family protein [Acidobacteriota bacterium]